MIWVVFLFYVLLDIWQVLSFLVLGQSAFNADAYVWTDPSIYVPIIMIVTLVFYGVLVWQLWKIQPERQIPFKKVWFSFLG